MSASMPDASRLMEIVEGFARVRLTLWGDLVADEFLLGQVNRISREAPVLILDHLRSDWVPGGAANTAANIAALGAAVTLVGFLGDDTAGHEVHQQLARLEVNVTGLSLEKGWVTPTKTRVSGAGLHTTRQQIVRIDRGGPHPVAAAQLNRMEEEVRQLAGKSHGLVVVDYGYNTVEPLRARRQAAPLRAAGKVVAVDSRWRLLEFSGVSTVTPNEPEVEAALGVSLHSGRREDLVAAGHELLRRLDCQSVLVTRGQEGMAVFSGSDASLLPVRGSVEVADVTGAGDTVMAVFAVAQAAGGSALEAAVLANMAGGLVVMKQGTATVSAGELRAALATFTG